MIQLYDSLKGKKVPLNKKPGETIKMYVCGPTVYDFAHLGHGRSAVAFDIIRRFLEFGGYKVEFAFNITDIEDKMIIRAEKEGIQVSELARKIIPEYKADYSALKIKEPTFNPHATEFIKEMIELIKVLEEKGHTYILEDGVYYDIKTFPQYGKLSHQKLEELEAGARIEERKDKRNHQDFVLWKFKKEGEPFWGSPWGDGRPGWHIECSAMSKTLLGESFDIHGGGLDLKFPHHECEIAQSEGASGKPLANIWMHNGYITINQEKMSKSLNNFFTLKEIFEKYNPRVVRFFLLSTHYRSPIEYSLEALEQAKNTLRGLDEFYLTHKDLDLKKDQPIDKKMIAEFSEKLSNDIDISGGMAVIFEWISSMQKETANKISIEATLNKLDEVLQILPTQFKLTNEQVELIKKRKEARELKDWTRSDQMRDALSAQGIEIKDNKIDSIALPML